jgi:hypothetical protein
MIKVDLKPALDLIDRAHRIPDEVAQEAFRLFRSLTPRRTGRAQRSTRLRDTTIQAQYPYAEPLDQGSSRQAPAGMTEPTLAQLPRILDQKVRQARG